MQQSFPLHKHDINLSNYGLWYLLLPSFHYHQRTVRWFQLTANILVMEFVLNKRPVAYRDKAYCFVRHQLWCTYYIYPCFSLNLIQPSKSSLEWHLYAETLGGSSKFCFYTKKVHGRRALQGDAVTLRLQLETSGENSEIADVDCQNCQG